MSYDYDENFLRDRVSGGPDKNRAHTMDQWFAAAQAGDQNALQQLANMGGVSGTGQGWATADARNYDKMLLAKLSGGQYTPEYDQAHDGGNFMHSLGGVLKVAAPLAGMAIPGVGALGAMAIGAGGSALGGGVRRQVQLPQDADGGWRSGRRQQAARQRPWWGLD
jgi:hypothetical protein